MFSVQVQRQLGDFALQAAFSSERDAGIVAVTGASGAGKSTVLQCIAGLCRPDGGRIEVSRRVLFDHAARVDVPVHHRRVGVVFQDARLFPHLSVAQNLRYGLPAGRPELVHYDDAVSLLGIDALLDRRPAGLSGGERQRVAIGRALLTSPALLLMDEPLASLDQARKDELLPFLAALPRRFAVPILYVTHSLDEVLYLADELVVMAEGGVRAHGAVAEAAGALVGGAAGETILEGTAVEAGPDELAVRVGPHELVFLGLPPTRVGERVRLRVSADEVILATTPPQGLSVRNRLAGHVVDLQETPRGVLVGLDLEGEPALRLRSRVSRATVSRLDLHPGRAVTALVKAAALRAFRGPGG